MKQFTWTVFDVFIIVFVYYLVVHLHRDHLVTTVSQLSHVLTNAPKQYILTSCLK